MSETASQLIATFDALAPLEQHAVITALLRRSGGIPDTSLSDDELTGIADEVFLALDREEDHGDAAGPR